MKPGAESEVPGALRRPHYLSSLVLRVRLELLRELSLERRRPRRAGSERALAARASAGGGEQVRLRVRELSALVARVEDGLLVNGGRV